MSEKLAQLKKKGGETHEIVLYIGGSNVEGGIKFTKQWLSGVNQIAFSSTYQLSQVRVSVDGGALSQVSSPYTIPSFNDSILIRFYQMTSVDNFVDITLL